MTPIERYVNIEHSDDPTLRYAVPEAALPDYHRQGFKATTWEDGTEYVTPAKREQLEEKAVEAAHVEAAIERRGDDPTPEAIEEELKDRRR